MPVSSNLKSILKALAAGGVGEAVAPGSGLAAGLGLAGMDTATAGLTKLDAAIEKLTKSFETFETKTKSLGSALGAKGWFDSLAESATKIDELGADLQRATGQAESLSAAIGGSGLGISMAEAGTQVASLHNNYADFSELSADVMKSVTKQAQGFTRLGVSVEDFGKAAENMTKGWGLSVKEMEKTQNKIHKAALSLGIAPAKMAKDLAATIPKLMHWGKASTDVFLRLAAQSKATGVEMGTLLGVAEGFDDFETAAGKVGQLNTLLGGPYLNTVQMLKADEEERIQILKNSISLTGKSIDQLGRWRVKDISKTMGFNNLADFYKAMGAPQSVIDKFKKKLSPAELAQINLNKAIGKGVKLGEVWTAWFERISLIMGKPFLDVMKRIATFVMSGDGMKGVTSIFDSFASGIKNVLEMWDEMDPMVKKQIKSFGLFFLKMTATSVAVTGFQKVLSPLIQMFTNPTSGLIAITTWLIANWGGSFTATVDNLRESFYSLDVTVRGWMDGMLGRWPRVHTTALKVYDFIQGKLTKAFEGMADTDWQSKFVEFIDSLQDGFTTISEFFDRIVAGSADAGGGFRGMISVLKTEVKSFIGDIMTELEGMILNRYGAEINAMGRGGFWQRAALATGFASAAETRTSRATRMAGSLGHMKQGDLGRGARGTVRDYLDLLQGNAPVSALRSSILGEFILRKHRSSDEGDTGDKSFWKAGNIAKTLEMYSVQNRNTGGHVKPKELTSFGQEEGLIYAPNGSAMVLAASQMGAFGGGGGGGSAPINLYVDGEKLASTLPLINALNSEIQTR